MQRHTENLHGGSRAAGVINKNNKREVRHMKKVDFNKLQAGDLVEVPRTQFAPMRSGWNGWLFSEAVVIRKGVGRKSKKNVVVVEMRTPAGKNSYGTIEATFYAEMQWQICVRKKSRGGNRSRQRKPAVGISLNRKPVGLQCLQLPCWQYGRQRAT